MTRKAEVTDVLYTIEDEPRMMAIHEETLRNEGYEKGRKEGIKIAIKLLMEEGRSEEEAIRKIEKECNTVIDKKTEPAEEKRNSLFSIEDEPGMMAIHEEALRNEGYQKGKTETRKEDLDAFIEILMESGLAKEEAIRKVEEKFRE